MKDFIIKPGSPLRKLFPLVRKLRGWAWKFHDRTGIRLVISGGRVKFMDVELEFPENVALTYTTPLFWNGPEAYEAPTSRTIALLARMSAAARLHAREKFSSRTVNGRMREFYAEAVAQHQPHIAAR